MKLLMLRAKAPAVMAMVFGLGLLLAHCSAGAGPIRSVPSADRKVILFEEFTNNSVGASRDSFSGLSRGFPAMILSDFAEFGVFRLVTEADRLRAMRELAFQKTGVTAGTELEIGRLLGAHFLLRGSFTEFQGRMSIQTRLVKVESAETIAASAAAGPTRNTLAPPEQSVLKKAGLGLLARLDYGLTERESAVLRGRLETRDIRAAANNYAGEKLLGLITTERIRARAGGRPVNSRRIAEWKRNARGNFEKALKQDRDYERARRNLRRLIGKLPVLF